MNLDFAWIPAHYDPGAVELEVTTLVRALTRLYLITYSKVISPLLWKFSILMNTRVLKLI